MMKLAMHATSCADTHRERVRYGYVVSVLFQLDSVMFYAIASWTF